jgi:hypothetical protein
MESALMVYGQSWRDPEKAYRERRWSIRKRLPTMPAIELQNLHNSLMKGLPKFPKSGERYAHTHDQSDV